MSRLGMWASALFAILIATSFLAAIMGIAAMLVLEIIGWYVTETQEAQLTIGLICIPLLIVLVFTLIFMIAGARERRVREAEDAAQIHDIEMRALKGQITMLKAKIAELEEE